MDIDRQRIAAVRKLKELGFTYIAGAGEWLPRVAGGGEGLACAADAASQCFTLNAHVKH